MSTTPSESAVETNPPQTDHTSLVSATNTAANETIKNHTLMAMGVGALPLPLLDFLGFAGIQLRMINRLAQQYDVSFRKDAGKAALTSLLGSALPVGATPLMGYGLLKLIPGLGGLAAAASGSLLGGALTYAVGKVFQMHFASGGTLLTFKPEKMRDYFAEQFEEGKQIASDLRSSVTG